MHTLRVVHAQRVVIDGGLPEQRVIGIVRAVRAEQRVRDKMVSHSPCSSQRQSEADGGVRWGGTDREGGRERTLTSAEQRQPLTSARSRDRGPEPT